MARILVVDDRPFNREFLATLLAYAGHAVDEARDGQSALARVAEQRPELLITDLRMPGMDGIELTRRLRANPATASLPVIFYTATYRSLEAADIAAQLAVSAVLAKPAEPRHILDTVSRVLGLPAFAAPAAAPRTARPANGGVGELQRTLRQSVSAGLELIAAPPAATVAASQPLAGIFSTVQSLSLRMAALIEVALELPAIRDLQALLDYFCRSAQDIMGVQRVTVGMLDPHGRQTSLASTDAQESPWLRAIEAGTGLIGQALASGLPQPLTCPTGEPAVAGLPASHPPVGSLLAVPLALAGRTLGWCLLVDKLGSSSFAADDEQFATTLATLLASAWDNLLLSREARQHAARIARLNRVYRVQSGVNAAIVRRHDRQEVFAEACRIAVEDGGFALAWAGLADPAGLLIRPAAAAGAELAELEHLRISPWPSGSGEPQSGSEALALRQPLYCRDLAQPPAGSDRQLCDTGLAHACRSFVALPLSTDRGERGLLVIYAREPAFFDDAELRLLQDLAADVSFALQYIEKEEQLNYLAYYDALTGLPNATLFADRLRQLIHAARHDHEAVAILILDLTHFKNLNDQLGRQACDQLLRRLARRMSASLRASDTLARLGADRFAIALAGLGQGEEAANLLRDRVLPVFNRPFHLSETDITLTARTGIAVFPGDGDDADALFRNAEAALKQAKRSGDAWLYYAPATNARMVARHHLENQLREAIGRGDFVLHYQPRGDLVNGQLAGAEALIRWQAGAGRIVPPDEFIPLAEETGLIVPLGAWVIDRACANQARWLAAGLDVPPVAVNLSAIQLARSEILETLGQALARYRLSPHYLELELTESAVMSHPEDAVTLLATLKASGLALSLDDFGTGYSSLAYLKRFPFDAVKIDRSFVSDITFKPEDAAIATAVIAMAHRLDMRVIAEGVETESQLAFVRSHGCNEIQGYYFSRPLPAEEFEHWLRTGRHLDLPETPAGERHAVLVVDADAGRLAARARLLAHDGYQVLTAASGRAGLELLACQSVQVIVSDQAMPGMSGTEFLRIVKALYPETLRIILTEQADLDVLIDAVNRGAVYKFLTRQCSDELLREHVRDALRRYRPCSERPA